MLFKLVKLAALFIGFALAVRSGSRGQVLGMVAVAGLFWTVASPSKNMFKPIMAIMLVAGMAVMAKIGIDFYWHGDKRFNVQMLQTDYAGRLNGVMFLIDKWLHSPFAILFGLGSSASYKIIGNYPHIVPLEVLCEEGILGFILLCAIIIGTVVKALRSLRSIGADRELRSLYACVAALWLYSLILINKQGSMLLSQDFFFFSVLLAKFGYLVDAKKNVISSSPAVAIRRGY
jgi:O-antigen ligase